MNSESNRKTIMITGASGGMGKACAEQAAKLGYDLILVDLATAGMEHMVASLQALPIAVKMFALDITDSLAVNSMATELNSMQTIDALVHTIGVTPNMPSWQKIVDIDLIATVKFLEAVRPMMSDGAAAVCISSSSGYMCPANAEIETLLAQPLQPNLMAQLSNLDNNPLQNTGLAYAYAKKALRFYVAHNAKAWGAEGKRLVSISPGLIATEAGKKEYENSQSIDAMKNSIALQRFGLPEEIVHTALFLVSEQASYISGCDILVDGGMIAGMGKSV